MRSGQTNRREFLIASAASTLTLPFSSAWPEVVSADAVSPFTFHAPDAALTDLKRRLDQTRWPERETAAGWDQGPPLTGYQRYVAQGGDWGAWVATAMAQQRAPGLVAIHLNFPETVPDVIPTELLPDQKRAVEAVKAFRERDAGYLQLQAKKPQLAGYTLADSPVAQAAWMYDIFNSGTGATGRPEDALSRDGMLDEITLFWLTDTAASSARLYLEQAQLFGKRNNPGRVDLPVGVSIFPHDRPAARSWAPQVYPQLFYWHEVERGGHFASLEVPDLFTAELRRCFRSFHERPM